MSFSRTWTDLWVPRRSRLPGSSANQRSTRLSQDELVGVNGRWKYRETGELVGAYGLADAANTRLVRRKDGAPAVTDGPYLETKEYIASFYLLDCESEEHAQRIAADMPFADVEPVELWPVLHESAADM